MTISNVKDIVTGKAGFSLNKKKMSKDNFSDFINQTVKVNNENNSDFVGKRDNSSINNCNFNSCNKIKEENYNPIKEKVISSKDTIERYGKQIVETVSEDLDVEIEQIQESMETLGLSVLDLLKSENLTNLVAEIKDLSDASSLILDNDFQILLSDISSIENNLIKDLNVKEDVLFEIISMMNTVAGEEGEASDLSQIIDNNIINDGQLSDDGINDVNNITANEPIDNLNQFSEHLEKNDSRVSDYIDSFNSEEKDIFPEDNKIVSNDVELIQNNNINRNTNNNEMVSDDIEILSEDAPDKLLNANNNFSEQSATNEFLGNNEIIKMLGTKNDETTKNEDSFNSANSVTDSDSFSKLFEHADITNSNAQVNTVNTNSNANITNSFLNTYFSADTIDIINQIVDSSKIIIDKEVTSMEMQLNPENLGKVYLNVSSKEGNIHAQMTVTNEAVKEALEAQIIVLKENLNQAGVKVDAVEVTVASHEFERNLEQNHSREEQEGDRQERQANQRRNINLSSLDELSGVMSEEESLVAQMMKDNGNSIDYTA